ncbi:MAG: hypothetical protein Q9163_002245 [Psora crenata]
MNAVRQKCRPKHQVLILKCYPRFQKNVQDVKPNPSELSYLLYYACTRRSKLPKVGAFLEKKAASDVYKHRLGNIQVTLQIMKALIEKLPRDLPLYATYILRTLQSVLQSEDLSMVEESIPTFQTFCEHYEVATMAADQGHIGQYEEIVRTYANYGNLKTPVQPKGGLNASIAVRWRTASLRALKSITASEAVGADGGRQMNIIMPVILQNLHSGDGAHLQDLQRRAEATEGAEDEQSLRRRMSIATVQTANGKSRPNSAAVAGIEDDADRIAEEEVGLLAIQCLKQIFAADNRAQIRLATGAMLRFICMKAPSKRPSTSRSARSGGPGTWSAALVEMVNRWAPVQDRFVVLVTIVETLIRSPIAEENLEQQLLLISLVRWLLRSSINMIGLSVMDVLIGLIQHILLLLQLGGKGSNVLPHHQQTNAIDIFKETEVTVERPSSLIEKDNIKGDESLPSTNRQELLERLQKCIGDLATHIYYSDQIPDIISAILLRLKPSPLSGVASPIAAIEHPEAAAKAISDSVQMQDNPETDEFFSFGTARVTALKAIREVLVVANSKGSSSGAAMIGRNRVCVQIWDGTQWLLRDEDRRVRRAYVDALVTWLKLEMSLENVRVLEDRHKLMRAASKNDVRGNKDGDMSRRAVSNASQRGRDKTGKQAKSTFLQLLHLAIYDNVIESPESEPELLLLHLLLYHLVEKLGVYAVKTGLPMIMRLQEDINIDELISTPTAKLNIGSLVHGYLWTLSEIFDFDASEVGYVIQSEMQRRKKHGLWLDTIRIPPIPLEQIIPATTHLLSETPSHSDLQTQSIKPFDSRIALVDRIAESYANAGNSPPTSPPSSPGRVFSTPILSTQGLSSNEDGALPPEVKEAMLCEWSKESCIATVQEISNRASSLNGSRRGTTLSQYLGLTGQNTRNGSPSGQDSPSGGNLPAENFMSNQPNSLSFVFNKHRHSSAPSGSPTPISSSDQNTTLRVDDLKRVLAGDAVSSIRRASPLRHSSANYDFARSSHHRRVSSSSESVASAEGVNSASEEELTRPTARHAPNPLTGSPNPKPVTTSTHTTSTSHSRNPSSVHARSHRQSGDSDPAKPSTPRSLRRPSTSSSAAGEDPDLNAAALRGEIHRLSADFPDEVPPVPPLPAGVAPAPRPLSIGQMGTHQQILTQAQGQGEKWTEPCPSLDTEKEKERERKRSSHGRKKGVDVGALLGSIDAVAGNGDGRKLSISRPPY